MKTWLKSLLSDAAGGLDDARLAAMLMVVAYIGLAGYDVIGAHRPFDMQQFGIGAGALSAGVGGWFKLRGAQ